MTQQWEPEWTIEMPLALELIQRQFPQLNAKEIRLLGTGWNNSAFVINENLIFRFPRRKVSLPMMEAEWQILPQLAPRLPNPIPVPKWKGSPTPLFSHPFIGYQMLPYQTACSFNPSEIERGALAVPIARFLAHLHQTPPTLLPKNHIFGDNKSRINWEKLCPKIFHHFDQLDEFDLLPQRKKLETIVEKLTHLRPPLSCTVVHGDFYVRHLLLSEKGTLAGVIDWGDIHLGDPALDLAIAHSFLPSSVHDQFRNAYGDISEETWSLALLRAIYSSTLFMLYGYHSKDHDIVREGLRFLNALTEKG